MAVVGAGYIAVELAGVLHELGSDTTLFCRGDAPLRGFDDLIQSTLMEEMTKTGLTFRGQATPKVGGECGWIVSVLCVRACVGDWSCSRDEP